MPGHLTGVGFTIASQASDGVTFSIDVSEASGKIKKDQRSLWISLTSVDANNDVVVAQNLPVQWDGQAGTVTFGLPGTQTHNFAYVWDSPDSGTPLATLTF